MTTCPVCNREISDSQPEWSSELDDCHLACADALLAAVLNGRRGNAYARGIFEVFATSARNIMAREALAR